MSYEPCYVHGTTHYLPNHSYRAPNGMKIDTIIILLGTPLHVPIVILLGKCLLLSMSNNSNLEHV